MPRGRNEIEVILGGSPTTLSRWVRSQGLIVPGAATAFITYQSYPAANELVSSVDPLVHLFIRVSHSVLPAEDEQAATVLHLELSSVLASPWLGVSGSFSTDVMLGITAHFRNWLIEFQAPGLPDAQYQILALTPDHSSEPPSIAGKALAYIATAAADRYMSEAAQTDYLYKLERVQSLLGLRPAELARVLNVSREGLRQWQAGATIASDRRPDIDQIYELSTWLAHHIRPDAVPSFIRRSIPALEHRTPLDWFVSRRFSEFRRIYERGFSLDATM